LQILGVSFAENGRFWDNFDIKGIILCRQTVEFHRKFVISNVVEMGSILTINFMKKHPKMTFFALFYFFVIFGTREFPKESQFWYRSGPDGVFSVSKREAQKIMGRINPFKMRKKRVYFRSGTCFRTGDGIVKNVIKNSAK
jgi:hypothetical protein